MGLDRHLPPMSVVNAKRSPGKRSPSPNRESSAAPPGSPPRKRVKATRQLIAYGFHSRKKTDETPMTHEIDLVGSEDEGRRKPDEIETLKADMQKREATIKQKEQELERRIAQVNKAEDDVKEINRLQACIAAFQLEMRDQQTKAEERNAKVKSEMISLLRSLGYEERYRVAQQNAEKSRRLGRIQYQRSAAMISEVWEDGQDFKLLYREQEEILSSKEALETMKKAVKRRTQEAKGKEVAPESEDWLKAMSPADFATQEEIIRLRAASLRKREASVLERKQDLEREKSLFLREAKRMSDQDMSAFNDFPLLSDRYLLLHLLGKGGFSEVFKAYDLVELRYVACKIHQLNSQWTEQKKENYLRHATREYTIQRKINHRRFVQLYDVFKIDSKSFCTVLELCEGSDLDTYLKTHETLSERESRAIVAQIFSGLLYLSQQKQRVIHYDLKPGNILYHEGEIKITDFGLSKLLDEEERDLELTSQGAGTYWYLPPECFEVSNSGPPVISSKVDVWSVGVILYQMLFGRRPFGHNLSQQAILAQRSLFHAAQVEFPNKPQISDDCKDFIIKCLTFSQSARGDVEDMSEHPFLKYSKK
eukprot:c2867_g1_i1.p1 GENE.c2867_g1_i1~~c2867_g1_i1.p1  ORF type:complete len:593 (+),score=128.01 c2867_g1_i1:1-1779(+)